MTHIFEVVNFVDDQHRFFQGKSRAWDYALDLLLEIGYGDGEVTWLKGDTAFVAVDVKATTRVAAVIQYELVDS